MDPGEISSQAEPRGRWHLRWPVGVLGPAPRLREINLACWAMLAAYLLLRIGVPLWVQFKTGVSSLHILPADFIYYYGDGRIANEYPLAQFYDYGLQTRIYNEIYPLQNGVYGMQPYPPFVPLFFSLYARLPFGLAFGAWMATSLLLYLVGVGVVARDAFVGEPLKVSLVFCFALAFYPFFVGTLINGQPTAIAVCAVAVSYGLERRERPYWSGLALSLLAYKPTLCLLLVPMLLVTRRGKQFSGFVGGVFALMAVATAMGGAQVWPAYARYLGVYRRVLSLRDRLGMPLAKHVDIGSCLLAISGGRSAFVGFAMALIAGAVLIALALLGWKSARFGDAVRRLVWAAAITWTLLVNAYVPIYDAALAAIAAVLTLGALKEPEWKTAQAWIVFLVVLVEVTSWFTIGFAAKHGIQLLSIALALLGVAQLFLLHRRMIRPVAREPDLCRIPG